MNDLLQFTADVELTAASSTGKTPRVSILAYTGDVMTVAGHGPVVLDLQGMSIPASLPVLSDHNANIAGIVGSATPTKSAGKLVAEGTLSAATEAGKTLLALHRDGVKFQASIGASPGKRRYIREGESIQANGRTITAPLGGFHLIETSTLKEISITALAADSATSVAIAAQSSKGNQNMTTPTDTPVSDPVSTERQRVQAIRAAFRGLGDDADAKCDELIASGASEIEAQGIALEMLRASRSAPVNTGINSRKGVTHGVSPHQLLTAAALLHAGETKVAESMGDVANIAADLRCRSLLDICASALRLEHRDIPRTDTELVKAAFSTTSLPTALSNAMGKVAMEVFANTPTTWRSIARTVPVRDFKPAAAMRAAMNNAHFERVGKDGELKHVTIGEETVEVRAHTAGRMFTLTRTDVINDDASVLSVLPRELGLQGLRTIADEAWRTVLANEGSFFSSGNNNLLEAASALAIGSLGEAVKLLRSRTDASGRTIDVRPAVLAVPPALEGTARQVLNSTQLQRDINADGLPTMNPWQNIATLEVESRLANSALHANASDTAWYLTAAPNSATPLLLVAFLNGVEAPTIESIELPGNVLGIGWRGYVDFGVSLADERGVVKATGASNGG